MGTPMISDLACSALRHAITECSPKGTIVQSNRGSQSRSKVFAMILRAHERQGTMGRVASTADYAAMDSLSTLLLLNVLNRRRWVARSELRLAIVTWIDRDNHRRRRQAALGKLTPTVFKTIYNAALEA